MSKKISLRRKTRINYCEPREPDFDEYVFCDDCNDYVYEYCSLHGPLLIIPDDEVPNKTNFPSFVPRAALTIPKEFLHLAASIIPGAGIGVFSSVTLPKGIRFGPYRGQCTFEVNSSYCWQIYNAKHKPLHVVDALDGAKSNWMRFVNCSRHFSEQNLAAFQYKGELYYRTIRTIPRFTELLVFYGTQFATALEINTAMYNSQSFVYALKFDRPLPKLHKINSKVELLDGSAQKNYQTPALRKIPKIYELHEDLDGNNFAEEFVDIDNDNNEYFMGDISNESAYSHQTNEIDSTTTQANERNNFSKDNIDLNSLFICDFCNGSFRNKPNIIEHLKMHEIVSNVESFACKSCQYTSVHINQFNLHLNLHDKNRQRQCKFCGYRFDYSKGLNRHILKHFRLLDDISNKSNSQKTDEIVSTTTQANENNNIAYYDKIDSNSIFICNSCNGSFKNKTNIIEHLKMHKKIANIQSFACNSCEYTSAHINQFNLHMRLHDKKRLHQCKFCGYRFFDGTGVKRHILKHFRLLDDQPSVEINTKYQVYQKKIKYQVYKCEKCEFVTTSEYNFNKHKGKHVLRLRTCDLCGRKLLVRSFKRHMKLVHKQFIS